MPKFSYANNDPSFSAVQITEGPYAGYVARFGRVKFNPTEDNDKLTMQFGYEILQNPNFSLEPRPDDPTWDINYFPPPLTKSDFEKELGDVLLTVIQDYVDGKLPKSTLETI